MATDEELAELDAVYREIRQALRNKSGGRLKHIWDTLRGLKNGLCGRRGQRSNRFKAKPVQLEEADESQNDNRIIDFDCRSTKTTLRDKWKLVPSRQPENRLRGKFEMKRLEFKTCMSERQKKGEPITLREAMAEVGGNGAVGDQVVDLWCARPKTMPRKYYGRDIIFTGAIYQMGKEEFVRYIYIENGQLDWGTFPLDNKITAKHIILLADPKPDTA